MNKFYITTCVYPVKNGAINIASGARISESQIEGYGYAYIARINILKRVLIKYFENNIFTKSKENLYLLNGFQCDYTPVGIANSIIIFIIENTDELTHMDNIFYLYAFISGEGLSKKTTSLLEAFCNRIRINTFSIININGSYLNMTQQKEKIFSEVLSDIEHQNLLRYIIK